MRQSLFITILFFFLGTASVYAADTHTLMWHTNTYTPPGFLGKPLPTKGSTLTLSLQTSNQSESFSRVFFAWYFNDVKLFEGMERSSLQTTVTQRPGIYQAKVFLRYPDGTPETITMPVKVIAPEILLIEEKNVLRAGKLSIYPGMLNFRALPFFFNATSLFDLHFDWKIGDITSGGQSPEAPYTATLTIPDNIPSGTQNSVEVYVQNLLNTREQASQSLLITTL